MSALERTPEPALMNEPAQVDAYASADWSAAHDRLMLQIADYFPRESMSGLFLNLGCGPGDDTFRFLRDFPHTRVMAIDGAPRMIERARDELRSRFPEFGHRVDFRVAFIPSQAIPRGDFAGIISNSVLHHFQDPIPFWATVRAYSRPGSRIFVGDLRRPATLRAANDLVDMYANDAPDVLRADFFNSLRAAFTVDEVRAQLTQAGLADLQVKALGDRHLIVVGIRA